MALYTGFATVVGISASGSTVNMGALPLTGADATALFGYAAVFLDSLPVQHTATFTEHIGADGEVAALQWVNEYLEISVTFRPVSDTSLAAANAKFIIIPKGAVVELSNFKIVKRFPSNAVTTDPAAPNSDIINTKWINVGDATYTLNASAPGEIQLQLRNYLSHQDAITKPIAGSTVS
jgi:hypothetical protein